MTLNNRNGGTFCASSSVVCACILLVWPQYFYSHIAELYYCNKYSFSTSGGTFAFVPLQCDLVPDSSVVRPVGGQDQSA